MTPAPLAILRAVPDSFAGAVRSDPSLVIDVDVAREQHAAYRKALQDGGFHTVVMPSDERYPDSPFIEDPCVVLGRRALLTRPGHPDRRGESDALAEPLAKYATVSRMSEPATLDGGDVLRVGRTLFVGISERSNRSGLGALGSFGMSAGYRVVPVKLRGVLHLKSAVTALDDHTVLAWTAAVDTDVFAGLTVVPAPGDDPHAANVVRLPDDRILTAQASDELIMLLAYQGKAVLQVDVSEFAKADGGLTCLSLRLRDVLVDPGSTVGT